MNFETIIDRLSKQPQSNRFAIYLGIYILFVVLYIFMGLFPIQERIVTLEGQRDEKQQKLALVRSRVSSLESLTAEASELKVALERAKQELPNSSEIPKLIKEITETGRNAGLEVRKFTQLGERDSETNDYVSEVPIALGLEGSFHEIAIFFDQLSKMPRIVHVMNINMEISNETASTVDLYVEGDAITFRFLTDEEREKKKDQRRR
ncbi:MAG: type 4a pilus biogenesis protein PilO [Myxococcota bacterium]|nr:type 4a pilus biogenesis protein PilO [Myxococcota bacterium]